MIEMDRQTAVPGDDCLVCDEGRLTVYDSRLVSGNRVQYLSCNVCHAKPERNKRVLPKKFSRPLIRRRR